MSGTTDAVKIKALRALLEDENLLDQILKQASAAEKSADAMGLAFKDVDLNALDADDLLEVALAMKEYETVAHKAAAKKGPKVPVPAEEDDDEDMADESDEADEPDDEEDYMVVGRKWAAKMDDSMSKMHGRFDDLAKLLKPKPADDEETTKRKEARATALEQTVADLQTQLAIAIKELQTIKGDMPRGVASGRPTQSDANVVREKAAGATSPREDFLNYVAGGIHAGY